MTLQPFHLWLIAAAALVLGELLTGGFVLLWFGVGAAAAAVLSLAGASLDWQLAGFGVASLALFAASRTVFHRFFMARREHRSGVYAMAGREAEVLEPIGPGERTGTVKVGGEVWSARGRGEALAPGERVVIEAVEGLKLRVRRPAGAPGQEGRA